jgi:hypothetical protein
LKYTGKGEDLSTFESFTGALPFVDAIVDDLFEVAFPLAFNLMMSSD